MGTALMLATAIGSLALAVVIGLLKDEAAAWLPHLSARILRIAVDRLPASQRERFAEEWQSHVAEYPGKLSQLAQSLRCAFAAQLKRRAYRKAHKPTTEEALQELYVECDKTYNWFKFFGPGLFIVNTINVSMSVHSDFYTFAFAYFLAAFCMAYALVWRFWLRDATQRSLGDR